MKLIAASNFRNTHKFKTSKGVSAHVEKGEEFEVDESDDTMKEVLTSLNGCGRIVDYENQIEAHKKIKAEVAAAKAKELAQANADKK